MKRLKLHIIRLTAIAISMFYMLIPIHREVKSLLHDIAHSIEKPGFVLSHDHDANMKSKFKEFAVSYHEHKIIDLLDFFSDENSQTEDSNKPNVVDISLDKHFYSQKYIVPKLVVYELLLVNNYYKEKIRDGFYRKIKIPPKDTKMQLS